ncbi:MAG: metallophosphoesterase [Pirellulales bacterium]|nr:metallophosphoesterase [Pirellulales bacterium]
MLGLDLLLTAAALAGHFGLWATVVNRVHATAAPQWIVKPVTDFCLMFLCLAPLVATWSAWHAGALDRAGLHVAKLPTLLQGYGALVVLLSPGTLVWLIRYPARRDRQAPALKRAASKRLDVPARLGRHPMGRGLRALITRLPGNECFQLDITEKHLEIPRLPRELDGLSIAQLSDLHFTGAIDRGYYREVVATANDFEADLIAVTGDLVDKPDCIDWIAETIGQLRAQHGVYVILGNHDHRLGRHLRRLRAALGQCDLVQLGGQWREISIDGTPLVLAGNELPWIPPAADLSDCPTRTADGQPTRVLLSHSPDQYVWARQHDFDLMLAGHTHGGQIRFPLVGPIFAPSRFGVRYASGVFHEPPTVMHVSRGLSGLDPLRYNCAPELTRIVLRSPAATSTRHDGELVAQR